MKRLNTFSTGDSAKLQRELIQLESNAVQAKGREGAPVKRLNTFSTGDSAKLQRELIQLESNVVEEAQSIRGQYAERMGVAFFQARASNTVVAIQPNQQLSVDTSVSSCTVVLPALSADVFGKTFRVITRSGLNSVQMTCRDPQAKFSGTVGAFPTLSGLARAYSFYCDSSGYYW